MCRARYTKTNRSWYDSQAKCLKQVSQICRGSSDTRSNLVERIETVKAPSLVTAQGNDTLVEPKLRPERNVANWASQRNFSPAPRNPHRSKKTVDNCVARLDVGSPTVNV